MADGRAPRLEVQFEHQFDRLLSTKLERVYALLVPDRQRPVHIAAAPAGEEVIDEHPCRDLRARVVRSSA